LHSKSKLVIACLVSGTVIREACEIEAALGGGDAQWPAWHSFPLLSRGVYILGNLTTTNEKNRQVLSDYPEFLRSLRVLLERCSSLLHDQLFADTDGDCKAAATRKLPGGGEAEEVVIKVIRLVANTSINASCGRRMVRRQSGEAHSTLELVVRVLRLIINHHGEVSGNAEGAYPGPNTDGTANEVPSPHEELLLNVVASVTNLTFYATEPVGGAGTEVGAEAGAKDDVEEGLAVPVALLCSLTKSLSLYLYHPNVEVVMEIIRAFGNLTRCAAVVEVVVQYDVQLILINLLASPVPKLRHSVVGILINLSCDETCRKYLMHRGAPTPADGTGSVNPNPNTHLFGQLLAVLKKTKFNQALPLQTSILACQVLCNFLGDIKVVLDRGGGGDDLEDSGEAEERAQDSLIRELCGRLRDCLEELVDCARDLIESHTDNSARPTTATAVRNESAQLVDLFRDLIKYGEIVFHSL
jgi:hypothetical protein